MNKFKIKPPYDEEVELTSSTPLFNLEEFLTNYTRLQNPGNFNLNRRQIFSSWQKFVRTHGFIGTLEELYRKYKVRNWRPFYQVIEMDDGSFTGMVHYKFFEAYNIQHRFDSRIELKLEESLDAEGKKWKPSVFTETEPVAGNIKKEVLDLIPFKNDNERMAWINRALSIALDYIEWTATPSDLYSEDEIKEMAKQVRKINKLVKDKEIVDFNGLKEYLKGVWVERRAPKIFR